MKRPPPAPRGQYQHDLLLLLLLLLLLGVEVQEAADHLLAGGCVRTIAVVRRAPLEGDGLR
jgi:hypothetical protein